MKTLVWIEEEGTGTTENTYTYNDDGFPLSCKITERDPWYENEYTITFTYKTPQDIGQKNYLHETPNRSNIGGVLPKRDMSRKSLIHRFGNK